MKKFKVKINCPGQILGSIVETNENGFIKDYNGIKIYPYSYPHIFEEIKEPLFVTADGKEIFDVNSMLVSVDDFKIINTTTYVTKVLSYDKPLMYKYFSTKEAAEKWIEENKPMFSKKQIRGALQRNIRGSQIESSYVYISDVKLKLGL